MKTLCMAIIAGMLSFNTIAGGNTKENPTKYCSEMKDGKLVVMHEGKVITADVTLADGTMVKMDATIVKKDGSKSMLKEGQCIDKNGVVMNATPNGK
jgi:hypothetical protein